MNVLPLNESLQEVIHTAKSIAQENKNKKYSGAHILLALLYENLEVNEFLKEIGKNPTYLCEWAEVRVEEYPKTMYPINEVEADDILIEMWDQAEYIQIHVGYEELNPLCVFASLVTQDIVFTSEQLKSLSLNDTEVVQAFKVAGQQNLFVSQQDFSEKQSLQEYAILSLDALKKYGVDLLDQAKKGCYSSIVGREREIRVLVEILGRKSKSNILLVGEPGVGKTTLIEGFANQLSFEMLPSNLKEIKLIQLDLNLLFAGTSDQGEVEDRLKKVIAESKQLGQTILFIDQIHLLLDHKRSFGGIANILKSDLIGGELKVIGATTQEEYRRIIEPELTFNRRFERVEVTEPDDQTCVKMMLSRIDAYVNHHNIQVETEALFTCVTLAKRYVIDRKLPDTAFDLLDRTMAAVALLDELSVSELASWKAYYDNCLTQVFIDDHAKVKEMIWLYDQLQHRVSPLLWGLLSEQPKLEGGKFSEYVHQLIEATYSELVEHSKKKINRVSSLELAAIMAAKTGIPLGKLQAQEKEKLLTMEELLGRRVVGQRHALKVISDAIVESRSGLNKPGQPIGSFFFLGPTGTGKTELAKAIASLLFNDEKAMIRFDMSEFKEEHAAALFYGAPPGYVGYEKGGMLVNRIREQPYSVILFDEIEKAHPSVFDVFLQLMDEGKIHDKLGKEGDFSNALVLFTSNIGSEHIWRAFNEQHVPTSRELMELMQGYFRSEFLARITEIVPFAPITEEMAEEIFSIQLKGLTHAFDRLNINFDISNLARKNLAISGFSSQYGARQISGVIRQEIARPISKMIVKEELISGQKIEVDWQKETVVFHIVKE